MQPIERYGLVSLLFVIVTVAVVLTWDFDEPGTSGKPGMKEVLAREPALAARNPERERPRPREEKHEEPAEAPAGATLDAEEARMVLRTRPGPLRRDQPEPEPARVAPDGAAGAAGSAPPSGRESAGEARSGLEPASGLATNAPVTRGPADEASGARSAPQETGRASGRPIQSEPVPSGRTADPAGPRLYVVKTGDTLSEISLRELGTSQRWKEIVDRNPGLDPAKLRVGVRLVLPDPAGKPEPSAKPELAANEDAAATRAPSAGSESQGKSGAAEPKAAPAEGPRYAIRTGDSLWKIAERTLGDGERWRDIAQLNPDLDPGRLHVGKTLLLPAGAQVGPTVAAVTASAPRSSTSSSKVR